LDGDGLPIAFLDAAEDDHITIIGRKFGESVCE
jgi:hypothetical protein